MPSWKRRKRASLPRLPLQPHEGTALNSVSASSAGNAWAVGAFVSEYAGPGTGFALHWNGTSWSRVSSANAWTVGSSASQKTVILHWNGSSWH